MLLTITTTRPPATDLGYLLHKHPERLQSFSLPFGHAHVFYPEATDERCTAALLLDVDPVGLIRRGVRFPRLDQYVNDRPYVASSFLSVAIARVFNSALADSKLRSQARPAGLGRSMEAWSTRTARCHDWRLPVAVLAIWRRPSEAVTKSQVFDPQDESRSHEK
jgi:Hen1-like subunit of RNA repair complex